LYDPSAAADRIAARSRSASPRWLRIPLRPQFPVARAANCFAEKRDTAAIAVRWLPPMGIRMAEESQVGYGIATLRSRSRRFHAGCAHRSKAPLHTNGAARIWRRSPGSRRPEAHMPPEREATDSGACTRRTRE